MFMALGDGLQCSCCWFCRPQTAGDSPAASGGLMRHELECLFDKVLAFIVCLFIFDLYDLSVITRC